MTDKKREDGDRKWDKQGVKEEEREGTKKGGVKKRQKSDSEKGGREEKWVDVSRLLQKLMETLLG